MNNLFKKGFASLALASAMTSSIFAGTADIHFKPLYSAMGDNGNQSISSGFEVTFGSAGAVKLVSSDNDVVGNNTVSINLDKNTYVFLAKKNFDDIKPLFKTGKVGALAVIKTPLSQFSSGTDDKMHVLKTGWEHLGFSSNGKGLSFSVIHAKDSVVATSPVAIKTAMTNTNNTNTNTLSVTLIANNANYEATEEAPDTHPGNGNVDANNGEDVKDNNNGSANDTGSNISFAESFTAEINKYANNTIENGKDVKGDEYTNGEDDSTDNNINEYIAASNVVAYGYFDTNNGVKSGDNEPASSEQAA